MAWGIGGMEPRLSSETGKQPEPETLITSHQLSETKSPTITKMPDVLAESSHLFADTRNMYWETAPLCSSLGLCRKVPLPDANIPITGENAAQVRDSTLKPLFHCATGRAGAVAGAVTESLSKAELFITRWQLFIDAHANRAGKFEAASRKFFSDEIGTSPTGKSQLLIAIQRRALSGV